MPSSVKRFTGLSLKDLWIFSILWFECFASHLFYLAFVTSFVNSFLCIYCAKVLQLQLSTFIHWWYHYYWQWFYLHHLSFLTAQFVFWTQEPWFSSLLPWTEQIHYTSLVLFFNQLNMPLIWLNLVRSHIVLPLALVFMLGLLCLILFLIKVFLGLHSTLLSTYQMLHLLFIKIFNLYICL